MRWSFRLAPALWLTLFFGLPFLFVLRIALSQTALAIPPYVPVIHSLTDISVAIGQFSFENFASLAGDPLYLMALWGSLKLAFLSTLVLVLIGYPLAYAMARAGANLQPLLLAAVILPFWTSFLIRVYAWMVILKPEGLLNNALMALGLIREPLPLFNNEAAVIIGLVYSYLPFMVLPLYATLEKLERTLVEAARDLGASRLMAFIRITVPLSLPGFAAGVFLCFIPIMGEVVIPDLLGGSDTLMIGRTLWNEFFANRDWPMASAVALVLLLFLIAPILAFQRAREER
jgi:putrescine transport system permease protein